MRLWDPRAPDTTMKGEALGGSAGAHTGWVSGLAWSPESAFHLFTCALDGEAKVWDVRASVPLHTLKAHEEKVCLRASPHAVRAARALRTQRGPAVH